MFDIRLKVKVLLRMKFKTISIIFLLMNLFDCSPQSNFNNAKIQSTLWVQSSAEYEILCRQTYNNAENIVLNKIKHKSNKPFAIITDIDETILNNSPYQAAMIKNNFNFPEYWNEWCSKAEAQSIPGAINFFKKADSLGIKIFYVSSRNSDLIKATIENLKKCGFPQISEKSVYLRKNSTDSKSTAYDSIMKNYNVILVIGDKAEDFLETFDGASPENRKTLAYDLKDLIIKNFILIPNPMYGNWERAVYNYKNDTTEIKRKNELNNLNSFLENSK